MESGQEEELQHCLLHLSSPLSRIWRSRLAGQVLCRTELSCSELLELAEYHMGSDAYIQLISALHGWVGDILRCQQRFPFRIFVLEEEVDNLTYFQKPDENTGRDAVLARGWRRLE